jgi:hypothetical protein
MTDLLELVLDAHGGAKRWAALSRFRAEVSITGSIWELKQVPGLLDQVTLEGETRDQRLKITPFPTSGRYAIWEPTKQTFETEDGVVVSVRANPVSSFVGQIGETPWDHFQAAYFASEANWNYLVAPFIFTRPDFRTEEIDPLYEGGHKWRSLLVTYPSALVVHCRQQIYHFDQAGLLRRLDYSVDILGGEAALHYPSEYREFDGILVPTTRLVYVRRPDGSPVRQSASIAIHVSHLSFS